jgi:DNA-binding response OmpR family regulator
MSRVLVDPREAYEMDILVVEDDVVIARLIERTFMKLGYSVRVTQSCAEAETAAPRAFRCGIFDIDLADGSGVVRARPRLEKRAVSGVVFYTGSMDPDVRREADLIGVVIDKLSPARDLEHQVMELLQRTRSRSSEPVA